MHELIEMRCRGCGFSLRGIPEERLELRACTLCGLSMEPSLNHAVSRPLPRGLGLLMGAFAASLDASPLLAREPRPVPGFARCR